MRVGIGRRRSDMATPGILKTRDPDRRNDRNRSRRSATWKKATFALESTPVLPSPSYASGFGLARRSPRRQPITRPKAATPALTSPMKNSVFRYGLMPQSGRRYAAAPDWFVPDSFSELEEKSNADVPSSTSSQSEPQPALTSDPRELGSGVHGLTIGEARPWAGGGKDQYDPSNHPDEALNYRNLTEFITVVNDKYRDTKSRTVLNDHEKLKRVTLRNGELLVDIRRDIKDVFRSKVLVSGDGGRNVNVETRMDPKFEKVLVTSSTKDPATEKRNRERERCLWLQEDRMRWIRALYEHIKEFRTQAKFYLALVIEARGRDPEYDPEEDEQVVAIRKQMIPWADEVMSNVLLLAGIETQIYADLQKEMPSIKM